MNNVRSVAHTSQTTATHKESGGVLARGYLKLNAAATRRESPKGLSVGIAAVVAAVVADIGAVV